MPQCPILLLFPPLPFTGEGRGEGSFADTGVGQTVVKASESDSGSQNKRRNRPIALIKNGKSWSVPNNSLCLLEFIFLVVIFEIYVN